MQETLQKAYEARMGLIAQQQETELVKEEIDSIEEPCFLRVFHPPWGMG